MIYSRQSEKKLQFIKGAVTSFVILSIIFSILAFVGYKLSFKKGKEYVLNSQKEKEGKLMKIYVAKDEIPQGKVIEQGDYYEKTVPSSYASNGESGELLGKVARININKNQQILNNMVTENENFVTDDLRKQDYSSILLNTNLEVGQYVDIRLKKKDGTDYVVASKKQIIDLNGKTIVLLIKEKERRLLNNAIVYASVTGSQLYTTIYIDPENQPAAKITYELDSNIDLEIEKNASILETAESNLEIQNIQEKPNFAN